LPGLALWCGPGFFFAGAPAKLVDVKSANHAMAWSRQHARLRGRETRRADAVGKLRGAATVKRGRKLKARYAALFAKADRTDAEWEEMAQLELEISRLENPDGPWGVMSRDFVSWREEQGRLNYELVQKLKRGGRPKESTKDNDVALAKEYLRRRKTSPLKDTRLKERIAIDKGLNPSTVIKAINRGLKYFQP